MTYQDFIEAYVTMGEACANIHDYMCAIKSFRTALKKLPGHVPAATVWDSSSIHSHC
eukprot:SAG31_NODE_26279_length_445_cov_0.751445_1_plen_56_part_01